MIKLIHPNNIKEFFRREKFEPDVFRALIISIALTTPLIVAHFFEKPLWGIMPAITGQLLASAKIEGSYGQKALLLFLGTVACAIAAFIGTLAGANVYTSVIFLSLIAGIASMARGIGDYGQVFGVSAVILFLISLYPPNTIDNAFLHCLLIIAGGLWAIAISSIRIIFKPAAPFYLAIAKPWFISSSLMKSVAEPKSNTYNFDNWIGGKETELRKAINSILPWIRRKNATTEQIRFQALKIVRASSRFGVTALTIHSELQSLPKDKIPLTIFLRIKKTAEVVGFAGEAVTDAIISVKKSDLTTAKQAIDRCALAHNNLLKSIEAEHAETDEWFLILHVVSLFESAIQYLQGAISILEKIENSRNKVSKIPSTSLSLRLKKKWNLVKLQFMPGSLLLKHSLRVMIMSFLGMTIYYLFEIPRGYWIVLTLVVLLQPEFGNTWERTRDRMMGTLLGVILGSMLLLSSLSFHFIFLIFCISICSFMFAYYQVKNYKIAVVFVTIMLVAMLDIAEHIGWEIAGYRLLSTTIGGIMAILGAYFLWPSWESIQFPARMKKAILANRNYLMQIGHEIHKHSGFHPRVIADRRKAEIENINVEDALKRLNSEPARHKKKLKNASKLADLNKKLTRELTSFSTFLPELKKMGELKEAEDLIVKSVQALNRIATGLQLEQSHAVKSEFEMIFLVIEAKMELFKDHTEHNSHSTLLATETSLLPYQLIYSELKKIVTVIKAMAELSDDVTPTDVKKEKI